jgi:ATP/maltotriose-dependent transcriptional regulator MalT
VIARAWLRARSARAPRHPAAPLEPYLGRIACGELARLRSDARRWQQLSDRADDVEARALPSESAEALDGPEEAPALRRCVRRARAIVDRLRDGVSERERRSLFRRLARLASRAQKLRSADTSAVGPTPATTAADQARQSTTRTRIQRLASDGLSRGEIARMLSVSEDTVKKHLRALRSAALRSAPVWGVPR